MRGVIGSDGYGNAADWAEWTELSETGEDRWRYMAKFGAVATGRIEGEVPPPNYEEEISKDAFEEAWSAAREQLEARWASHGRHLYEIEAESRS